MTTRPLSPLTMLLSRHTRRREFIALLVGAAAAWPLGARAQQLPKKMLRVGTVSGSQKSSPQWAAFARRMAELGYQEGKTFAFDLVPAANAEEFETGYRTLAATRTLPIVMVAIDYDPFARGYLTSLARPSGNVTGVVFQQIELAAKRIQLVKDAFPDMPAATMFWDRLSADQWQAAEK